MIKNKMKDKCADLFHQILSACNAPVLITDAMVGDHPIVFVNAAFELTTGYSAEESWGKNCRFLQGGDIDQPALRELRLAIEQGRPCECTVRNYRKDGKLFWNQLYIFPLRDANDVVTHFVGIQHDVTTAHEAMADLLELRQAIERSVDICIKVGRDATILSANQAIRTVLGQEFDAVVGASFDDLPRDGRQPDENQHLLSLLIRGAANTELVVSRHRRKDGMPVEIEWSVSEGSSGDTLIAIGRDVTARRLAEAEARSANDKVQAVLDSITEGCFSLDHDWRVTYINEQGARWLGRRRENLIGNNIWDEFPDAVGGVFHQTYQRAISSQAYAEGDAYYPPVGRWLNARAYPSREGLTVFFLDVSDRKRDEERMLYAASHDQLTSLMNRDSCLQKLEDTLARSWHERLGALAVLFMDLDKFKEVNDALGHRVGDHVLRLLGERLKALSTDLRYCARLSGDEFLFVLDPANVEQAQSFARRVIDQIVKPFEVAGRRLVIGASIGIAMATEKESVSASDLINRADTAMYAAKASGRLAVRVFSAEAEQASKRRLQLRGEMASAVVARQFLLHYQPQIRLSDGSVAGVEALVRWNHPMYGLLGPAAFLDIAEESPLILQLGAWVCDEACRQLAQWKAHGHHLQVAINVSARQLVDPNFAEVISWHAHKHGIDPHCIELEVTESMLSQDLEVSSKVLTRLVEEGFKVALDDFGTGFSNLAYIKRLPVGVIKIDRSFVTGIDSDPRAMDLIKGIIAMAKSLKLAVICEGVETQDQRLALEKTSCDIIQGYLISKPVPADDLRERFLR
jgi:diguanylate cyclase (GGDEF)-like protein/PAS domain S-box-containing protein